MAALLCVFTVFVETLGIIYRFGPLRKRVALNIQFCYKEVWLELNNELRYEFYYTCVLTQT